MAAALSNSGNERRLIIWMVDRTHILGAAPNISPLPRCISNVRSSRHRHRAASAAISCLALFGRWPSERVVRSSPPAAENLHLTGHLQP